MHKILIIKLDSHENAQSFPFGIVIGPASLIGNIKREEHPQTLIEYKKGYVIMCVILFVIVLGLCATGLIVGLGTLWMNLAFTFATLYNLFNAIILYKAKKAYDAKAIVKQ